MTEQGPDPAAPGQDGAPRPRVVEVDGSAGWRVALRRALAEAAAPGARRGPGRRPLGQRGVRRGALRIGGPALRGARGLPGPRAARAGSRAPAAPAVVVALGAGYLVAVRPRLLRWGATDEEVRRPFPGHDVVPGGRRSATMAVTLDAPPEQVWPWLAQMGTDRAGWYSWDRLDDFGRRSADRVHPEWQAVHAGDRLLARPDGSEWWEVAAVDPGHVLCLRMSLDAHGRHVDPAGPWPRRYTDSTWTFVLTEQPGRRTRLVVSGYWHLEPRWLQGPLGVLVLEPAHWVMQTRQFAQLRRRVEHGGDGAVTAGATAGRSGPAPGNR